MYFNDAWIRCLSCKSSIYVSWSISELRMRLAPWNWFKPPSKIFYWPFIGSTSFVNHLCYLCILFVMLSRLFIAALWSPAGLASRVSFVVFNCVFVTFPVWYPLSGVVLLDCFSSWSLPPFLLSKQCGSWSWTYLGLHCFPKNINRIPQDKDIPAIL